ncbi:MAG TPA: acetyl-CoA hydrolase/transferase C-terminal domain-containing protein [Candidatus Binataceae bacterium]|jgi:acyl-CoA hydrolase|nr:acetyl-CoA hydrolase/transferase C-terminal domain-containing protein [Candidatus Binataceae bacterium]
MASAARILPDWRAQLGARLVAPDEAVAHIKSGDRVTMSIAQGTPFTLCHALAARLMELEGVVVNYSAALFAFDLPGLGERFRLESFYLSPLDRKLYHEGPGEFVPLSYYRTGHLPPGLEGFNVYLMTVSPPDERGEVNFGDIQIMSKLLARKADLVIAEIDPHAVRIGGDNSMHISEIDYFVERAVEPPALKAPPPPEEERRAIDTIGAIVAKELIPDRATIQVGVGSTSGALAAHLRGHHDLGMQTEIIPIGTTHLVRDGVITGKYKKMFPGLVVGSGFAIGTPREELDYADGNPLFQLYDFNYTDDIRTIAREEGLISVNNALCVDLTGQVGSESIGHQMYTGTGGQTAFGVGASLAGGKSIIVLPSSALRGGQRLSRITPSLPPATVLTLPRTFVHYVVTEFGIATLIGRSLRERARELIAVAHPDFRAELTAEARRMYG